MRLRQRQDGGFDPDLAGTAVQDEIHAGSEAVADVIGCGWRELGEAVCTWPGQRNSCSADQRQGNRVRRHSDRYRVEARGNNAGNAVRGSRQDKRQGPRPEFLGELFRGVGPPGHERFRHVDRSDVNDERAGGRTSFDCINARYGLGIKGIGAKAVNGFGGKGD